MHCYKLVVVPFYSHNLCVLLNRVVISTLSFLLSFSFGHLLIIRALRRNMASVLATVADLLLSLTAVLAQMAHLATVVALLALGAITANVAKVAT